VLKTESTIQQSSSSYNPQQGSSTSADSFIKKYNNPYMNINDNSTSNNTNPAQQQQQYTNTSDIQQQQPYLQQPEQ
ncbi:12181_t:CDS:2, partial [Racocetra fulgida]